MVCFVWLDQSQNHQFILKGLNEKIKDNILLVSFGLSGLTPKYHGDYFVASESDLVTQDMYVRWGSSYLFAPLGNEPLGNNRLNLHVSSKMNNHIYFDI
jgi:hypothetical protein